MIVAGRLVQQQRLLGEHKLTQGQIAQQIVERCAKQNEVADKQYNKLIAAKRQAILGRTRNPKLSEQRSEVDNATEPFFVLCFLFNTDLLSIGAYSLTKITKSDLENGFTQNKIKI
jgi:hypothetical protein